MAGREMPSEKKQSRKKQLHKLILYNDDVNTFDHVIDALMYHCGFSETQAEQCAWITHTRGKCTVKEGDYDELKTIAAHLADEGLTVEVH
ncbi:MAG: ATP-dependent Clp protease adaptor ClpS [Chlorobi bacterium]|nr:ATP-dependent Clp protease adaptor ClpS [Chlorobiota bacterium]